MPDNDVELVWSWIINSYTVSLNPDNWTTIDPITGDYNSIVELPTPTKTGYTFNGW